MARYPCIIFQPTFALLYPDSAPLDKSEIKLFYGRVWLKVYDMHQLENRLENLFENEQL